MLIFREFFKTQLNAELFIIIEYIYKLLFSIR